MSAKRVKSIRLIQVEAFLAVVDHQSFTEAAEILGCDQSTVSRYVDELGDLICGFPLLHAGTAQPNEAGTIFLPAARDAVEAIEKGKARIAARFAAPRHAVRGRDLKI